MALNMGSAIAYLELDTSKFKSGFKSALDDLKAFTAQGATVSQKLSGLQSAFSTIGGGLTKGLTLPLAGVGTAAVKTASDFEKQMSAVQAISQSTGSEFDALRDTAIELGGSTSFSASEVASAMTEMAKAGWDSSQIIDGMGGVLDAAAASGEDLASVGTIVADALTSFGLEAGESTRVADLLTQAANSGTIGINDLAESYKYIAPIAKTMGFSIEDVTTSITALSTAGIKGSQAGTALRGMLSRMVNPTEEVGAVMSELGIDIADSEGNFYSLDEILSQMRGTFKTLTPEQQAYYASILAGQEGVSSLTALLGMSQEEYDKISASMENADGVAKETAETMQDNLAGAVEQLGGALESAAIVIGERLIPYIRQLADWITGLVEKFNGLSESQQDMIVKIGLFAAAIGPVLLIFSKVASTIVSVIGVFTKVSGAFTAVRESIALVQAGFSGLATQMGGIPSIVAKVMSPFKTLKSIVSAINPVVAVIGVLVGAFTTLWNTNESFRNSITNTWNSIKLIVSGAIDEISEKFAGYGITFEGIINTVKNLWIGFCNIIAPLFTQGFEAVMNVVQGILGVVSGLIDVIGGLITGNFDTVMAGISQILTSLITMVTSVASNILQAVGQIGANILTALGLDAAAQAVQTFFNNFAMIMRNLPQIVMGFIQSLGQLPGKIKAELDKVINNVKTWATNMANNAKTSATNFINNVVNGVKSLPSKFKAQIGKVINSVKTWASNMASNAANAATQFISNVINTLSSLPGQVSSALGNVISAVVSWISGFVSSAINAATQFGTNLVNTLRQIPSQVVSIGSNIVNGVWQGIQNAASSFVSKVTSFFKGIVNSVKGALGIHSPSTVFDKEIGQNIVKGVIKGVDKQKKNAKKNAKELSKLYVEAAEEKLNDLKEINDISIAAEIEYWKRIKKETKKGSAGYKQANREIKKLKKDLNEQMIQLEQGYMENVAQTKEQLLSDIKEVEQAYDDAIKSRQEEILSSLGLFDVFTSETENTTQTLISNLQSQVNALNEWSQLLVNLEKRGISQGLLEELQNMGVESLADIRLLNSMTDEELDKYVALWEQKQSAALKQSLKEVDKQEYLNQIKSLINEAGITLDELETEYKNSLKELGVEIADTSVQIGQDLINGITNGINSKYPEMKKALKDMCKKMTTTVKKTLKIASPSKVFAELGGYTAEGFGVGFTDEIRTVNKQVENEINDLTNVGTSDIFSVTLNTLLSKYREAMNTMKDSLSGGFTSFSDGLDSILTSLLDKLYTISGKMAEITYMWHEIGADSYISLPTDNKPKHRPVSGGTTPYGSETGGDTYNFYNTKPDPYEYARQMKKAKKEMLYGY